MKQRGAVVEKRWVIKAAPALVAATVIGVSTALVSSSSVYATPDAVATAQKNLDMLRAQSSAADAKYSALQAQVDAANVSLTKATAQLKQSQAQVAQIRKGLGQIALINFQTAGLGATTQLVTSSNDSDFLGNLAVMQSISSRSNGQLQELQSAQADAQQAQAQAQAARDTITKAKDQQAKAVADIRQKMVAQQAIFSRLDAAEKARLAAAEQAAANAQAQSNGLATTATSSTTKVTAASASGRAATAIAFAMAQIGKPYVWGATGPNAYDCSGLMQAAWAAAGVSISRVTYTQINDGTHISVSQLQPGDLVFYYPGVTHVAMYIGNGQIVHAANPSAGIKVSPVGEMPIVGATHIG